MRLIILAMIPLFFAGCTESTLGGSPAIFAGKVVQGTLFTRHDIPKGQK